MKRLRKITLFLAVNLLVICGVLEVGTRVTLGDQLPPRIAEPHPDIGFVHRAEVHSFRRTSEFETEIDLNAQGLHDRDYPYEKPDGVYRVVMIGDSFVAALEVEQAQNFSSLLEVSLTENTGRPVEVVNGGVLGYGTSNAVLWLEEEGLRYDPDLIIYGFYPNDVTDNLKNGLFHLQNGTLVHTPPGMSLWRRLRPVLYDASYLYRAGALLTDRQARSADDTLIETPWRPVLPIYRAELQEREEGAWALTTAILDRLAESSGDIPLMVVYFPEIYQTVDAYWEDVEAADLELLRDAPNDRLADAIPEGVAYLDISPDLRAADEELYFVNDGHFNEAGHRLVARLLEAAILPLVENESP